MVAYFVPTGVVWLEAAELLSAGSVWLETVLLGEEASFGESAQEAMPSGNSQRRYDYALCNLFQFVIPLFFSIMWYSTTILYLEKIKWSMFVLFTK